MEGFYRDSESRVVFYQASEEKTYFIIGRGRNTGAKLVVDIEWVAALFDGESKCEWKGQNVF